jgi:sterol desaturase/sphingolipid hydroxylase (fatty acid hydroxylase superfamily)
MEFTIISLLIGIYQPNLKELVLIVSLRLVMPPTLFLALAYPWYKLAHTLFPYYMAMAIYSGGIMGYITYDMTHYFLHHRKYVSVVHR